MCKVKVFDETIDLKENAMLAKRPELFNEWDFEKNSELELDVYKVTYGSKIKAWWKCELGHEWIAGIKDRNRSRCPYCANQKVLIGFNDMWTTNPYLASQLLNKEDGYKYTQSAGFYTDWKCLECGSIIKNKKISNVYRYGVVCSGCKDSISYPEKIMFNLFGTINVNISTQKEFSWSNSKRYDFYLEILDKNIVIETHGEQHYGESNRRGSRTLEEEQENDRYKEQLAKENGIDKYIVIDCRNSYIDWIKNSIMNSELVKIFDLSEIDWKLLDYKSRKSTQIEFLDLWNKGLSVITISKQTGRSVSSIARTLSKFAKQEQCIYPRIK